MAINYSHYLKKTPVLLIPFLFVWELPQIVLGLLVWVVMKYKKRIVTIEPERYRIFVETPDTGVSLGWFVYWTPAGNRFTHLTNDCRMHEYGHAKQSTLLGPLYLVVVGIPSLMRVLYRKWYYKKYGIKWENYYKGFPENWADRLGGVMDA
jgi:hypothetical protein